MARVRGVNGSLTSDLPECGLGGLGVHKPIASRSTALSPKGLSIVAVGRDDTGTTTYALSGMCVSVDHAAWAAGGRLPPRLQSTVKGAAVLYSQTQARQHHTGQAKPGSSSRQGAGLVHSAGASQGMTSRPGYDGRREAIGLAMQATRAITIVKKALREGSLSASEAKALAIIRDSLSETLGAAGYKEASSDTVVPRRLHDRRSLARMKLTITAAKRSSGVPEPDREGLTASLSSRVQDLDTILRDETPIDSQALLDFLKNLADTALEAAAGRGETLQRREVL